MTTTSNTPNDVMAFIDYLRTKGLMNDATARGRKAAVAAMFSVLDETERADVTAVDLDELAIRFLNKRGGEFQPSSVKVYKARVASALADFKKYRADPLNFKVGIAPKPKTEKTSSQPKGKQPVRPVSPQSQQQPIGAFLNPSEFVFPVPIRPNTVVKIVGLPSDLSKQEAARIANVITALATGDDT